MRLRVQTRCLWNRRIGRRGAALLVVLFIVMAVTVVSLGFLSRSDAELASGSNMLSNTQMRYLADSALEHARGLLLNPQGVSGEFWTGGSALQLAAGDDYYDLAITRAPGGYCTYNAVCTAYRNTNGERTAQMALTGAIRLDPCIAFYCGGDVALSSRIAINGDVYVRGDLNNRAEIVGDAYANSYSRPGTIRGGRYNLAAFSAVAAPVVNPADYPDAMVMVPDAGGLTSSLTVTNRTLIVNGDLVVDNCTLAVTAPKNAPAMLLNGSLIVKRGATVNITGYVRIVGAIDARTRTSTTIRGALHLSVPGSIVVEIDIDGSGRVVITADPMAAALRIPGTPSQNWSPAASAFYKSIARQ